MKREPTNNRLWCWSTFFKPRRVFGIPSSSFHAIKMLVLVFSAQWISFMLFFHLYVLPRFKTLLYPTQSKKVQKCTIVPKVIPSTNIQFSLFSSKTLLSFNLKTCHKQFKKVLWALYKKLPTKTDYIKVLDWLYCEFVCGLSLCTIDVICFLWIQCLKEERNLGKWIEEDREGVRYSFWPL